MHTIKVYVNIQEMTGIGEEWLVDADNDVIAVFYDGNFQRYKELAQATDKTLAVINEKE